MFAISTPSTTPERGAECERPAGVVGVNVHLERRRVADDEERVADPLELGLERVGVQALALDDEDRAVAELGQLEVDRIEADGVRLDGRVRDLLPGGAVDHPARDLDETCAPGVHDAGVAKDVEHLGRARESVFAAREHHRAGDRWGGGSDAPSARSPPPSHG